MRDPWFHHSNLFHSSAWILENGCENHVKKHDCVTENKPRERKIKYRL